MPASFHPTGVAEKSATKAVKSILIALPMAVVSRTKPDWLAFPSGALKFNSAFG